MLVVTGPLGARRQRRHVARVLRVRAVVAERAAGPVPYAHGRRHRRRRSGLPDALWRRDLPARRHRADVVVPVVGDTLDEPNETFHLALGPVTDGTAGAASSLAIVLDDDGGAITLGRAHARHRAPSVPDAAGSDALRPVPAGPLVLGGRAGRGLGRPRRRCHGARAGAPGRGPLDGRTGVGARGRRRSRGACAGRTAPAQPQGQYVRVRATGCTTAAGRTTSTACARTRRRCASRGSTPPAARRRRS